MDDNQEMAGVKGSGYKKYVRWAKYFCMVWVLKIVHEILVKANTEHDNGEYTISILEGVDWAHPGYNVKS